MSVVNVIKSKLSKTPPDDDEMRMNFQEKMASQLEEKNGGNANRQRQQFKGEIRV